MTEPRLCLDCKTPLPSSKTRPLSRCPECAKEKNRIRARLREERLRRGRDLDELLCVDCSSPMQRREKKQGRQPIRCDDCKAKLVAEAEERKQERVRRREAKQAEDLARREATAAELRAKQKQKQKQAEAAKIARKEKAAAAKRLADEKRRERELLREAAERRKESRAAVKDPKERKRERRLALEAKRKEEGLCLDCAVALPEEHEGQPWEGNRCPNCTMERRRRSSIAAWKSAAGIRKKK